MAVARAGPSTLAVAAAAAVALLAVARGVYAEEPDCSGEGESWGPGIGPPPDGCGGGGGGGGGGDAMGGGGGLASPDALPCDGLPCGAPLLNDVAYTVVSGSNGRPVGEDIYGPFEAGFSAQQDNILASLGCASGKGYVAGGIDTATAEAVVARDCGVDLPRVDGGEYVGIVDACGGHTADYHFHERMSCLYDADGTDGGGHSPRIGEAIEAGGGAGLYGMWEDAATHELPLLDACGAHFGPTPDGEGVSYHYHVQERAPFTFGCYGPDTDAATGEPTLVTLARCRELYVGCGGGGDAANVDITTVPDGPRDGDATRDYALWCPCYDGAGSNVGDVMLAVFSPSVASGEPLGETPAEEGETPAEAPAEESSSSAASTLRAAASNTVLLLAALVALAAATLA